MITTKQVNVNLKKGRRTFERITTKSIDASAHIEPPDIKGRVKPKSISTGGMVDAADITEKRRRDAIMEQRATGRTAEILAEATEQGKEAIEALTDIAAEERERVVQGETFQEIIATHQAKVNEIAAREKMLKLRRERRNAAARARRQRIRAAKEKGK